MNEKQIGGATMNNIKKTLYGTRQSGKSYVLLSCMFLDKKGVLAVHNYNDKVGLQKCFPDFKERIFTVQELELKDGDRFSEKHHIYHDNADLKWFHKPKYPIYMETKTQ